MLHFDKKTLGFDYQLTILSQYAKTSTAKDVLLALPILTSKDDIESSWEDIDQLMHMHFTLSSIPMNDAYALDDLIKLLDKGHLLTVSEAFSLHRFFELENAILTFKDTLVSLEKPIHLFDKYVMTKHLFITNLFHKTFDDEGMIVDDASDALFKIRKQLKSIDQRYLKSMQQSLSQYHDILNEQLIVTRGEALCLAVNDSYKNQIKGMIHDVSQSGLTIYIEPNQAKSIRSEKSSLLEEEKKAILEILKHLTQSVMPHLETLKKNLNTCLALDVLQSKTLYSIKHGLEKPTLSTHRIELIKAWHLELNKPVPIHVMFSYDEQGLFITGPNTGGKTVTLKTIGLCQLMAQAGLFIPASSQSKVMILNAILADIGDDQSIMSNLSTFSGHIKKHIDYLTYIPSQSLVLIDEIGSGTDPQEGVSLAKSLLETYISKHVFVVVTTHYQALKQFAIEHGLSLASVAFNRETLAPEYHIQMGISGQSHAFDIAYRLGMPESILTQAKDYYHHEQKETDKLLITLQEKSLKLHEAMSEVHEELSAIKEQQKAFELEKRAFHKQKENDVALAIHDAKKLYEKKIIEIESLLSELKQADLKTVAKVKGDLQQVKQEPLNIEKQRDTYVIGDIVFVSSYEQEGVITNINKHTYTVDLGKFSLNFRVHELQKRDQPPKKDKKNSERLKKISYGVKPTSTFTYELDLRGFRYEEVKPALDKAIDQALFSNQVTLRVIHGFGTGAVRNAVYDIIKKHPSILSYRYGMEGEGLNGVTIITFK